MPSRNRSLPPHCPCACRFAIDDRVEAALQRRGWGDDHYILGTVKQVWVDAHQVISGRTSTLSCVCERTSSVVFAYLVLLDDGRSTAVATDIDEWIRLPRDGRLPGYPSSYPHAFLALCLALVAHLCCPRGAHAAARPCCPRCARAHSHGAPAPQMGVISRSILELASSAAPRMCARLLRRWRMASRR